MPPPADLIALSLLPVWRWRTVSEHLRSGRAPLEILHEQCADAVRRRGRPPGWTDPAQALLLAERAIERAASTGLQGFGYDEAAYPPRLLEIVDPPPVLWVAGQPQILSSPAVAIVGSRAGSAYSLNVAERLAADLASRGLTIVSGLARGVDAAAHRGALGVGGVTVGVLGCGADIVYPPEHAVLATAMRQRGAVISEMVPGTVPRPLFFPRRNRLISGLSVAVIVVEAGERSGSLITARLALEQGRDVLAVPGNVLSGRNRGGHALLRDGARLVETADDVLEELGWGGRGPGPGQAGADSGAVPDPVVEALLPGEPSDLGEISLKTGLSAARLLPLLLDLELRGVVRRVAGGRFVRFDSPC